MPNLIKVVSLDSGITSGDGFGSMRYVDDIVKRYRMQKNGFRFTFVQEIKSAKTIFDYDKYNPGSGMAYSLLLFNPRLEEKKEGELKNFLEEVIKCVPVIMCSDWPTTHWENKKKLVEGVNYNSFFGMNLTSLREGSGYFLTLENIMNENLRKHYQSKKN